MSERAILKSLIRKLQKLTISYEKKLTDFYMSKGKKEKQTKINDPIEALPITPQTI